MPVVGERTALPPESLSRRTRSMAWGISVVGVGVAEGVVAGGDLPLAAGLGGDRHAGVGARLS